jgi:phospholipid-binding lipoprotein MlaA
MHTLLWMLLGLLAAAPLHAADDVRDPWQGMNRKVFAFNDVLDRHVATPVARGYQAVTPAFVDTAVTSFFRNLGDVTNGVNFALQGEGGKSFGSLQRVIANTLIGLGGVIDVASPGGVPRHDTDFGITLGKWGVSSGPYLVLPVWGPSSPRDASGVLADMVIGPLPDPLTVVDKESVRYGLEALMIVDKRADLLQYEQAVIGDRYTFMRDLYLQNRDFEVKGAPAGDPFLDDEEDVDEAAGR